MRKPGQPWQLWYYHSHHSHQSHDNHGSHDRHDSQDSYDSHDGHNSHDFSTSSRELRHITRCTMGRLLFKIGNRFWGFSVILRHNFISIKRIKSSLCQHKMNQGWILLAVQVTHSWKLNILILLFQTWDRFWKVNEGQRHLCTIGTESVFCFLKMQGFTDHKSLLNLDVNTIPLYKR